MTRARVCIVVACAGLALAIGSPRVVGEAAAPPPEERRPAQVQAVYVETPPVIDGKLDDECWSRATRLEGFFAPDIDQAPPEETVGLVCVDATSIYVGVTCKDRTPEDITAGETRRNGVLWHDDYIEAAIEPYHSHVQPYAFRVNARGTQAEDVPGGSATKIEWRGDWRAGAMRTEEGWTAELAIPFSILRYPPGQSTFGLTLARGFAKERIYILYPVTGRSFDPKMAADLVGLAPPTFRPRPIFMPYSTLDVGDTGGDTFGSGMDVQYRLVSGLTGLATYRPDFTQIEDAVEPISFSYTERYLPDLRPFFVTGEGYFPDSREFYSRRVGDFDGGMKLFGTVGNESYGILNAYRAGMQNAFAARWRHQFTPDHDMSLWLVDSRLEGDPANTVVGFGTGKARRDGSGEDRLWATYRASFTEGGGTGAIYECGWDHFRGADRPLGGMNLRLATRGYDPALGYFYDQNSYGAAAFVGQFHHNEKGRVRDIFRGIGVDYSPYLHDGKVFHSGIGPVYSVTFRSGYVVDVGFSRALQYDEDSSDARFSFGWKSNDTFRRGDLTLVQGVRTGGDYHYVSLTQRFRPREALSLSVAGEYSSLAPPSPDAFHGYQTVLTTSYDLTAEKSIAARLIARDAGVSAYLAYRQVVRRGTDIYVILGDPDPERTGFTKRLAVKLSRVF